MQDVIDIVNYAFFSAIPIEFLYLDAFAQLFGGGIAFYMGSYGLITRFCEESMWAPRMGIFDGLATVSSMIGSAVAPYIFFQVDRRGPHIMSYRFMS